MGNNIDFLKLKDDIKTLAKIYRIGKLFIALGLFWYMFGINEKDAYKEIEKHLEKTYGEEFFIDNVSRGSYSDGDKFVAGIIYPKRYIGTVKEKDWYYRGTATANIGGLWITNVEDTYGDVFLKESANKFYLPKLKELFGENVLPIFELESRNNETDFYKEIISRNIDSEKNKYYFYSPIVGRIFIFGRIENSEDKEWYREQIFKFIEYFKRTQTFEYITLYINIIDERILADNSLSYIEKLGKIQDVDKDFKVLDEAFKNTSKESMKKRIENFSKSDIYDELNKYSGYLISSTVISPKRLLEISEGGDVVNNYDKVKDVVFKGEKLELEGIIKETGEDESYFLTECKDKVRNGSSKQYDKDGNIIWTGNYKDDLLVGESKHYYQSGKIKEQGFYKNGKLDGEYIWYYENGNISSKGIYKNGLLEGKKIDYYESGEIDREEIYKNGKLNGMTVDYYENGNVYKKIQYKDDKYHGAMIEYNGKGLLNSVSNYKNGKLDGIRRRYSYSGKKSDETNYKNGRKNGVERIFYEDETLKIERNYVDGYQFGEEKYYYSNGKLAIISNYENGSKQGEEKIYSPNWLLEENNYKNGRLHGLCKKYREEDGILEYEILYDNGEIIEKKECIKNEDTENKKDVREENTFSNKNENDKKVIEKPKHRDKKELSEYTKFYEDGTIAEEMKYDKSRNIYIEEKYDKDGKLIYRNKITL